MARAFFRFFGELSDFLPAPRRARAFEQQFNGNPAAKDLIESLGVPHPEIELLTINGESATYSRPVLSGDHVTAYPHFSTLDVSGVSQVIPPPLPEIRFVLDGHLGKLARYLRMLGFDCLCSTDHTDAEIARLSQDERRIALTRDVGLLKRSGILYGRWIRNTDPRAQLLEVIDRYDLLRGIESAEQTPRRCLECNSLLEAVQKDRVLARLPRMTREAFDEFFLCARCDKVFWKGSHYEDMIRRMDELIARPRR